MLLLNLLRFSFPLPVTAQLLLSLHLLLPGLLTPPTAITRLLIPCLVFLATAWIGAFVWVVQRRRSLLVLQGLGLLVVGLELLQTVGCQSRDQLLSCLYEPPSTSSFGPLDLIDPSELVRQQSISGCCHPSRTGATTQTPSLIPSHRWLRQRSIVPHLALIFLSNNGDLEDCREGLPNAVCAEASCRRPACSGGSRGICGAYHGERERNFVGFASGFCARAVDSSRLECFRGLPLWTLNGDGGSSNGGGRCRTRGSLRHKHQLLSDGLQLGRDARTSRVRPCDRRRRDPVFLGRITASGPILQCPALPELRVDGEGRSPNPCPVLLCRRGEGEILSFDGPREEEGRAPEQGQEAHYCCLGRAGLTVVPIHSSHYQPAEGTSRAAGEVRGDFCSQPGIFEDTSSSSALPGISCSEPCGHFGLCQKVGTFPRTRQAVASAVNTPCKDGLLQEDEQRVNPVEMAAPMFGQGENPTVGAALMQQSQAMNALVAHLIGQQDPMMDLSGGGLSMSLSSKGTKARERLMQELANKNGTFFLQVAQNAFRRLRPSESPPKALADFPRKAFFSKYMERQGGFAGQRDLGLTMWLLSQVADAMICQEPAHAQDLLALAMVALEQVAQDGGKWELGYLLSLQEDPPGTILSTKATSTNPRMRAFAPLCPQPWATVALSYLREMDVISSRRAEASSSSTRKATEREEEDPQPAPKRRPKFPKKPKAQEWRSVRRP